ncbi:unnamed protein product [Ectocarpus sp. CCAP 1310/34]|nr:unnamed protein product [Ectocarpus sp. CCAP 1310/34]
MAGRDDAGIETSGDPAAESSQEVASLKAEMGSLSEQISQLTMLPTLSLGSCKMEESGGAKEGAAGRGNATESVDASPAQAHGGTPQVESARTYEYLHEPVRESDSKGRYGDTAAKQGALNLERCGHKGSDGRLHQQGERPYPRGVVIAMGWGYTKDKCATQEVVLAQVVYCDSDMDSVENQAFCPVAGFQGECGTANVDLVGATEHGQDVMQYVADTAATCSMFRCANAFVNYRECGGWVKGTGGDKAPIPLLGYGDVIVVLRSEGSAPVGRIAGPCLGCSMSKGQGGGDFGGGGDFDSPTDSTSSSDPAADSNSDSSSGDDPDDDGGGGHRSPGDAGSSKPGDLDGDDGGGNKPGEDSENLEEYKFNPAASHYPPGLGGKRLLGGAPRAGPLRHGVERGRTRKQTRELQGSEEAPNPEEALLATALETEHGAEIVAAYVRESLVKEYCEEEVERRASMEELYRREMQKVLQSNDLEQQAFGAEVDDGSTQRLPDPQLSIPSPIGQKPDDVEAVPMTYKDVLNSKYKVFWVAAMRKEIDGHDKTRTFTKVNGLPEGRKATSARRVFSRKTNEKSFIVDFKPRLVAWFFPNPRWSHSSSACPIVASIKTVLAVSTEKGMKAVH